MDSQSSKAIVDTVADGVIVLDSTQKVTLFNYACEQLFGYSSDDILGSELGRLIPDADPLGRLKIPKAGFRRMAAPQEKVGRRRNGKSFPAELSVGAGLHQGQLFYVAIVRDLTERNFNEGLRERLFEQLTLSNEDLTSFSYIAAHELRSPLRMLSAYCDLLSKDYGENLDDRGREFLGIATSAALQMRDLLDDLVDYGRIGVEDVASSVVSANDVLDAALTLLRVEIGEAEADITRDELPEVYCNSIRLQRLMQNLIGNSIKYVGPGVRPRIHVSAIREGERWRLSVTDNGIGIEERHLERIFAPFKRLHAKDSYYGTGLGLSICRRIVAEFGGDIAVSSTPGKGSTFTFAVPGEPKEHKNVSAFS